MRARILFTAACALALGCGAEPKSEDYGATSTAELVLTSRNHPHGWAQSQCYACHVSANIHVRSDLSPAMSAAARRLSESRGLASCSGCHGTNGVSP